MAIETVAMSNYKIRETRPSALGLKQDETVCVGFKCPRCEQVNLELGHGKAGQCSGCGLHFRLYGNKLNCNDKFIPSTHS